MLNPVWGDALCYKPSRDPHPVSPETRRAPGTKTAREFSISGGFTGASVFSLVYSVPLASGPDFAIPTKELRPPRVHTCARYCNSRVISVHLVCLLKLLASRDALSFRFRSRERWSRSLMRSRAIPIDNDNIYISHVIYFPYKFFTTQGGERESRDYL